MKVSVTGRIDNGTTYPADERAPEGSKLLGKRPPSLRTLLAQGLTRVGLVVLRARPGDVVVVVGGERLSSAWRRGVNEAVRATGCHCAVFMPDDVAVHVEPSRLAAEDRGYAETKVMDSDKENRDRGVWIGTPETTGGE